MPYGGLVECVPCYVFGFLPFDATLCAYEQTCGHTHNVWTHKLQRLCFQMVVFMFFVSHTERQKKHAECGIIVHIHHHYQLLCQHSQNVPIVLRIIFNVACVMLDFLWQRATKMIGHNTFLFWHHERKLKKSVRTHFFSGFRNMQLIESHLHHIQSSQ